MQPTIVNGSATLFWLDNWYLGQALKNIWSDEFAKAVTPRCTIREFLAFRRASLPSPDAVLDALELQSSSSNVDILDHKSWETNPQW